MKRDEELLKQLDRETFDEEWYKKYPPTHTHEEDWMTRFYRGVKMGIFMGLTTLFVYLLVTKFLMQL